MEAHDQGCDDILFAQTNGDRGHGGRLENGVDQVGLQVEGSMGELLQERKAGDHGKAQEDETAADQQSPGGLQAAWFPSLRRGITPCLFGGFPVPSRGNRIHAPHPEFDPDCPLCTMAFLRKGRLGIHFGLSIYFILFSYASVRWRWICFCKIPAGNPGAGDQKPRLWDEG